MKELILLAILIAYFSISGAVYYGQKRCTFDEGICEGWRLLGNAMIANTTTHNFTVSGNFTQNDSFVYLPASSFETTFLVLPTYYRLCQISLAVSLNMTSLEVFPYSNLPFHFYAATQEEPLLPWSLVNISIPSYTRSLSAVFRNYNLRFIGVIADDFGSVGEGEVEMPSNGPADFYVGLDDVTLTYCLPCNFDDLSEPGNLMLTILPEAVNVIQLMPLASINITLQAFSSICDGQRFMFQILNMSAELEQYSTSIHVITQQLTNNTARLNVMFSSYNAFTGGAQNFTITVGAGIMYSNYLGYGTPPMVQCTVTLAQPGLISTRVPPDPIYYIPEQTISYQIEAQSVLAPTNTLKYEFAGTNPPALNGLLGIGLRSGIIAGLIMTEEQAHLSAQSYVNVTINDSANNKLIKITIPVILGQLAPTFLDAVDDVIIVPVREDTQPHSVVATFRVMDLNNDTVSISFGQFLSGPPIFSLNLSYSHQLILNSQLDYETPTNYSFTIEAAEMLAGGNTNPLTSTATVIIQVLPVNEYPPVIMPMIRPIQLVVPETAMGSLVTQVTATDQDSESHGTLNYHITRVARNNVQIPPQIFTINSTTGDITITQLLEEGLYNYTITVLVADMGTPPMTATVDLTVNVIGHQKSITCEFSVNSCDWITDFHVQNSQAVSPVADYNTNSLNTGGYVFLTSSQITGGSKIFLTLDDIMTSVINEILFVYQLNGSVSMLLQASSRTIWSSASSPGVAAGVGDWRRVTLYAGSLFDASDHVVPTHLQFVAMGSLEGFAAVDDLTVQVKSHCNYDSLSNPEVFNFDLPSVTTIPLNEPKMIPSSLTLTECRNEPVIYGVNVLPDHLMSYFSYNNGAINVQGLNSIIASNGTTGTVMVSATITAVDLFEGSKHFTYNDTVNFVVISLQQCVVTKQCSFNVDSCDWQIFNPVTLTTASSVGVTSRSSGQLVSGEYSSTQNLTLAMSTTINGSYCRVSFYYYATSGITLSVHNPSSSGELWISSLLSQQPGQWNLINVHVTYSFDPREEFDLSFRVSGVGLLLIDDVTLHPCIDCETGCRNIMCPAGEFYTIFDGCQPCLTGHYCPGGTSSAIPCAAGTFNDAERSTSNSSCKTCSVGSYSISGSTDCSFNTSLTCAPGLYPNISDGVATCVLCQPGSACPTGSILWPCPEGFTASTPGAVNCTICPAGNKCPNVSSGPIECKDKQYSFEGEVECHDCPEGFICNDSSSAPIPQMQLQTTMKVDLGPVCSEDHSNNSRIFIIIIIIIIVVALLIITLMTCYIVRLRYRIVKYQESLKRNDVQYAARDGNIAINSTYQPYSRNSRLSKDGLDLSNFNTCDDDDGDVMENEGYREEEIEMSEKNTMSLLVPTDGRSQL